ncbi:MAG: long-chain-fatty-acid--CoA ligase [Hydrocarboniphaga sp.]|uniref:AMP-binding protein n=1 Tax=Hydrocarboniphaga sp. TaxID=2033016 RepID=UPI00260B0088|nr:AMP-binding protein [Hydrocarboniphaga sp.]MDB5971913.1 long-chain-fatty-acid--CoA ligase [Hydrocarboniphaga sp.]
MTGNKAAASGKIWLSQYSPGVPAEIDLGTYQSVVDILESACKRYRNLLAYECMGISISYDELDRLTQDFASYLQNVLGLNAGDRVAIMLPNLLQYPVVMFGILRAGLIVVNVNPLYTPRELEHQLNDSGARAIVIIENFCVTLQQVLPKTKVETVITTEIGDLAPFPKRPLMNFVVKRVKKMVPDWNIPGTVPLRKALARGRSQPYHRATVKQEDTAFLQYTGGTTGVSKGAQLLHRNIVGNVLQARAWLSGYLNEGKELIITALPLYHIFALTANCLVFLSVGGKNVLIPNPRDMPGFIAELRKHRFTAVTGVNTLFNGLLNTPGFADLDFSSLRFTLGGGAAVQQAVAERWKKVTGKPLSEAYGLTETSPAVCINPMSSLEWNGTIGTPIPSTDVVLRDDDNHDVAAGEPGELCVKGPQVMAGYWNLPEETAKVMTADGYLRTGDIATMDERGYFKIVDRKKDMIIVSGFNVYPNEIEDVVAKHSGVLECACVGVPDDKSGEAVKVVVVKRDPDLTVAALREHCKIYLTGYKIPKIIEFRTELPKSPIGKILRKELRGKA